MLCVTIILVFVSSSSITSVTEFEACYVMGPSETTSALKYTQKGLNLFSIILAVVPLNFSYILDLLVIMSTRFAEWDINMVPSRIKFNRPNAMLALGKIQHLFLSRMALQREDKQCVRLFHVGDYFFRNEFKNTSVIKEHNASSSNSHERNPDSSDESDLEDLDELSLDYLPNELKFSTDFKNEDMELILNGPECENKTLLFDFFRGVTLCTQAAVVREDGERGGI